MCRERNVAVIEDAAEAVGATYKRRPAGSFGTFSAFSFHGSKTFTTGDGGILPLDDEDAYKRCLVLRDHGRAPGDVMYWSNTIGQKYRMSAMQAALGLAQLERLPELIGRKRAIFDWYRRELTGVDGLTLNAEAADVFHSYWMVTVVLDPRSGWTKDKIVTALREHDIDCRSFFHPLSMLPAYQATPAAAVARRRNAASYAVSPYGVNLPSTLSLTEKEVSFVVSRLKALLRGG
jgi:perosamine synthetase